MLRYPLAIVALASLLAGCSGGGSPAVPSAPQAVAVATNAPTAVPTATPKSLPNPYPSPTPTPMPLAGTWCEGSICGTLPTISLPGDPFFNTGSILTIITNTLGAFTVTDAFYPTPIDDLCPIVLMYSVGRGVTVRMPAMVGNCHFVIYDANSGTNLLVSYGYYAVPASPSPSASPSALPTP